MYARLSAWLFAVMTKKKSQFVWTRKQRAIVGVAQRALQLVYKDIYW